MSDLTFVECCKRDGRRCEICGKPATQATRDVRVVYGSWLEFGGENELVDDKIHWRCDKHPRESGAGMTTYEKLRRDANANEPSPVPAQLA